ncbi:MAG: sugar porter family MFS transporter [Akkermansiaceae bacterium]|nr:sugar porter family MFS transporter [Akkermansiaceae bacterium]
MNPTDPPKTKMSKVLMTSAIASSIGSFLFGFDTAVISGANASIQDVFSLDESQLGYTAASALVGALVGAALIGKPCEKYGRIKVLFLLAALYLVSALGCAFNWDIWSLVSFRFIGGLAVGGASVVSPMYITEITPPRQRGVLVAVSQLNIVLGILAAYVSNYVIISIMGSATDGVAWRWMFGMEALPAALFLFSAFIIPESPRWLAHKKRHDEARKTLLKLGYQDPDKELRTIEESFASNQGRKESLLQKRYMKPLLLVCMLAVFNQLDGINVVLYYAPKIFELAGFSTEDAFKQSMTLGLVNLIFTLVGMALIDRIGRKLLLLVGSVTFIASHALAAWVFLSGDTSWLAVLAAGGVAASHAYSQGAVIWVCINELLPNAVRAVGSATACFVLWFMCILVSTAFPPLIAMFNGYVFVFFAAMMMLQFILIWIFLPETKRKSLEQIEADM